MKALAILHRLIPVIRVLQKNFFFVYIADLLINEVIYVKDPNYLTVVYEF